jgi:aminoglycoside phosphotransferase (APT) family kinase protein
MTAMAMLRSEADSARLDWAAAARYLAAHGHRLDAAPTPRQFAGGLGNWNFLVSLDGQPHVLRRPPEGPLPLGANDMAREWHILSRLYRVFPLAPRAPVFCDDAAVLGAPFLLLEYREGCVVRDTLPAGFVQTRTQRRTLADRVVAVLAQLHAIDPAAAGLQGLGRPDGMVARQARNWTLRAQQAFDAGLPPALARVADWLTRPPPKPQRTCLLHSDYKLDNLILSPASEAPVALIDWDMGTLGDPLLDLATLLSYWVEADDPPALHALGQMPTALPGFPTRAQAMQLYAQHTGLALDDFNYYRVLALFKLCAVFQQLHRRHAAGGGASRFASLVPGLIDITAEAAGQRLST